MRLAVEPAQIVPPGAERPGHAIACGVLIVVRVRRGDDGEPELARRLHPGDAKRELGRHMNHSGTEGLEVLDYLALPGKGPLHVRVEEERHARRAVHLRTIRPPRWRRVGRAVDPHRVAAL